MLGVVYASWAARLPSVRDALSLDALTLGNVLLGAGLGSVCSFPIAASLINRCGARRAALWSGTTQLIVLPLMAALPNWQSLMVASVISGMACSCFDVAINALGAEAERLAERPTMSLLHAWFCVGTFAGAILASMAAYYRLSPALHFMLLSTAMAPLFWLAYRSLPSDRPKHRSNAAIFAIPKGALLGLGTVALLGAINEGSLSYWIPLYLHDHLRANEATAPLAYAAYAAAMLLARLVGDTLKVRFGARQLVGWSSLVAAAGITLAVLAPSVALAMVGFTLAGFGVAAVFPCVFSAAGREGSNALAGVASMGYGGSLLGPPMIAYLIGDFGLQAGLSLLAVVSLAVAFAGFIIKRLDAGRMV